MKAKNCKDDAAKAAFLRRVAALDEMEKGEQARREIKEKRWKLEEDWRFPIFFFAGETLRRSARL